MCTKEKSSEKNRKGQSTKCLFFFLQFPAVAQTRGFLYFSLPVSVVLISASLHQRFSDWNAAWQEKCFLTHTALCVRALDGESDCVHKFLLRTEPVIESDWSRSGKFSSQHCGLIRDAEAERESERESSPNNEPRASWSAHVISICY